MLPDCECRPPDRSVVIGGMLARLSSLEVKVSAGGTTAADDEGTPCTTSSFNEARASPWDWTSCTSPSGVRVLGWGSSPNSVCFKLRLGYSSSRNRSLSSAYNCSNKLTLENILSLIASEVCIPVMSTKVNCSLSVVTCSSVFCELVEPDRALPSIMTLLPLSLVAAGVIASSGLATRGVGVGNGRRSLGGGDAWEGDALGRGNARVGDDGAAPDELACLVS